jgi:hypothetical protein
MFGGMLLLEFALNLVTVTFGTFFSTLLVYSYSNGEWNMLVIFAGSSHFVIAILSLIRLHRFLDAGQSLCDRFSGIRDNLEVISVDHAELMNRQGCQALTQ